MYKTFKNDICNRVAFENNEALFLLIQYLKHNPIYKFKWPVLNFKKLKSFSKTSIKNFCSISGRSRGVLSKFKVSRIVFRYFSLGNIYKGINKN